MGFGGYLKQSTAVDILIGPFVDDADGDTPITGSTLVVELSKNGQALAVKNDATAPVHDAAGSVDGYYNCELDTTDTDTLGILTVVIHHADSLPVRLDYQVVTATWWDSMCGADKLEVDVVQVEGAATLPELAQAQPPAEPTLAEAMMLLYMRQRNSHVVTTSEERITNDLGNVITKGACSDVGSVFTRAKLASGP